MSKQIVKEICKKLSYDTTGIKSIGSGGSGSVYQISKKNKYYAIKIVTNKSILPRFKLEIETSIKLKNHGVIDIIDYSYDDAPYYYIRKLLCILI